MVGRILRFLDPLQVYHYPGAGKYIRDFGQRDIPEILRLSAAVKAFEVIHADRFAPDGLGMQFVIVDPARINFYAMGFGYPGDRFPEMVANP